MELLHILRMILNLAVYSHLLFAFYRAVMRSNVHSHGLYHIMPHCADFQAILCNTKLNAYAESQSHMLMQGWTVFHLVSLIRHNHFGWSKFHGSLFETLMYCHTTLSYSDAEVGDCVAHDVYTS